jgi:periplasmic divalent cation tolerance protein
MNKKSKLRTIYCTFPTKASAEDLAFDLVTEKLAACVNIFPLEASVYKWKQKICIEKEYAALIKTSEKKLKKTISFILKEHPYEIPCLVVYKPEAVSKSYDRWISSNLK